MNIKPYLKNWKTTVGGAIAALIGLLVAGQDLLESGQIENIEAAVGLIIVGVTAFFSRDADKSSEDSEVQKQEEE